MEGSGTFEREPVPACEVAEAELLAAALWEPEAAAAVAEVEPWHWTRSAHRTLAAAVAELVEAGRLVDLASVTEVLALADRLDEVGGPLALHDLLRLAVPAAWRHHLGRVQAEAARRQSVCEHIAELRRLGVDVREVAA